MTIPPTPAQIEAAKRELPAEALEYTDDDDVARVLMAAHETWLAETFGERWLAAKDRAALKKRPVMWRVMNDNVWDVFSDEETAQRRAEKLGVDYQGLYVRDGT